MTRSCSALVLAACTLISLSACAAQPTPAANPSATDTVMLAGQSLTLENHQQRCALRKADQSLLELEIPWPCAFSPDRKGQPRIEAFNDNALIVIAYHSQAEPAPSRKCLSQYQAIRLIHEKLETSVVGRMSSCMNGSIDQKNFVGLFRW